MLVGLDGSSLYIRRHCEPVDQDVRAQRLHGYFTSAQPLSFEGRRSLEAQEEWDRFGTAVTCEWTRIPEMPRTEAGAIDREELADAHRRRRSGSRERVAPRTDAERRLADIWQKVLGVPQLGIHDNFFELGGHSLLATQVISRIRDVFEVDLAGRDLFKAPTVAGLAERIGEALQEETSGAPGLVRASRKQALPLSFAQQRLWFIDRLDLQSSTYNLPAALRLTGPLNVECLERSLQEIVRRHEALRTTFEDDPHRLGGAPTQVIGSSVGSLEVVDLSEMLPDARAQELTRVRTESAWLPFDLERGPLFRTSLLKLGEEEHVLLLTMHHIVSDGWSMGVLMRELETLYNAFHNDQPSPLPELPIQYADYAVWQREWLQGETLQRQIAYWKEHLGGAPALLELPADRPRPPVQSFRGAVQRAGLTAALTQGLKGLGQREGATLFMTLMAAFQVLLSRYSGQDDLVVGTPIANRTHSEIEGMIGFFVNTLALRTDLSGDPTFLELLGRVREAALGAYAHQDLPFEKLVEELQPERSLSHSPLFQVMLVLQNAPYRQPQLAGLMTKALDGDSVTAKYDLNLEFWESDGTLDVRLEYSTDLFDAATIERLLGHFRTLLEGIVAQPQQRLSRLPMLTEPERTDVLGGCRAPLPSRPLPPPPHACLHELFEAQVLRTPDARALTFEEQHLTYQQLNHRANQLAHASETAASDPTPSSACACRAPSTWSWRCLASSKPEAPYVPLDPTYPKERLAFLLEDACLPLVLTHTQVSQDLPPSHAALLCLDDPTLLATQPPHNLACTPFQDHLAYLIYTSGSTGRPKGVPITHANVTRLMAATQGWFAFDARDVWTLFHSLAFDFSVWELWGALLYGGRLVVVSYWVSRSPDDFLGLLQREGVTVLNQTPSAFGQLLARLPSEGVAKALALRWVIFGGEALEPASLARWYALYGAQDRRLINMYGITETTVHVTYRVMGFEDTALGHKSMIGGALPDLRIYVLGPGMQPVPVGVAGELYVGGAGLGRGYLGRAELTAERFVPDPFSAAGGSRLYRSGDLARYLANGDLEYLGRADDQVKIRGFRIELGEIASVLQQGAGVGEAVVVAREDVAGEKRLVGYVVGAEGLEVRALREHVESRLPSYMVPSAFVLLEQLPLTSNGKIDRKALPAPTESGLSAGYVSARTAVEEGLAEIWCEVLGAERVGIYDNFFELGGHSLLVVRLLTEIEQKFSRKLPLATIFEAPTIAALAAILKQKDWKPEWKCVAPIRTGGTRPPFFWLHHSLGDLLYTEAIVRHMPLETPFYGVQSLGLDGNDEPLTRIEEMAEFYIREIRSVQPEGPYYLGGYSLGVIALEVAQQLMAQGERVGVLALLDPDCRKTSPHSPKRSYLFERAVFPMVMHLERNVMDLRRQGVKQYLGQRLELAATLAHIQAKRIARRFQPPMPRSPRGRVYSANIKAARAYQIRPYPGRITYFYATQRHPDSYATPDTRLAWSELAEEGCELHLVPGHHNSMVRDPSAKVLAQKLALCLARAYQSETCLIS